MFAPGPHTARYGKRPMISSQDPEFERFIKAEFQGGLTLRDFVTMKEETRAFAKPPVPPPTPHLAEVWSHFLRQSLHPRRTKPSRALSEP